MPLYEFRCDRCKKKFSLSFSVSEYEKRRPTCPKCKGRKISRVISSFTTKTSRKS
ncbi:MAG: FmdB family zinc ribbon protein [Nitrospinota bacterium]